MTLAKMIVLLAIQVGILLASFGGGYVSARPTTGLSPYYYAHVCPRALPTIKRVVEAAVQREKRMGASLLRLHFHDCFVNGCDASILLDPTSTIDSEKFAGPNNNSARGFEVIDQIKAEVDKVCGGSVISCADILAVAARDSVVALGGPSWTVRLGRRDSLTASRTIANRDIPSPIMDVPTLISTFRKQGLNAKDLVALSGAHTIGFAQCRTFKSRIHSPNSDIKASFAKNLQGICPLNGTQFDSNLAKLDPTAAQFDTLYYQNIINKKGLLQSDQVLFSHERTSESVKDYSEDIEKFRKDFTKSMIKMGNIKPLLGNEGELRRNCRRVN
ncbi:hypothetical protein MLD38_030002 [Melastoma candidum]|uniref:Uncharacterized protein n=1 Tax=Melastoma candidum TaxID=119954 RepID=A0ACB9MME9_9MYRT|nr:hypothetical protein MLD38_030002 [Melastoma candidum]